MCQCVQCSLLQLVLLTVETLVCSRVLVARSRHALACLGMP